MDRVREKDAPCLREVKEQPLLGGFLIADSTGYCMCRYLGQRRLLVLLLH